MHTRISAILSTDEDQTQSFVQAFALPIAPYVDPRDLRGHSLATPYHQLCPTPRHFCLPVRLGPTKRRRMTTRMMQRHIRGILVRSKHVQWQVMGEDKNCEGIIFNNISTVFTFIFPPAERGQKPREGEFDAGELTVGTVVP